MRREQRNVGRHSKLQQVFAVSEAGVPLRGQAPPPVSSPPPSYLPLAPREPRPVSQPPRSFLAEAETAEESGLARLSTAWGRARNLLTRQSRSRSLSRLAPGPSHSQSPPSIASLRFSSPATFEEPLSSVPGSFKHIFVDH